MKTKLLFISLLFSIGVFAQVVKDYDPAIQRVTGIQYFKPVESHLFTGDCMPYYYKGTFYIYWLLDEGHHAGLGGLGGHQWALSTSEDLVTWEHYPVAVGIDEEWEKSICTGSVIADKGKFYAFYSTRVKDDKGVHEQLSYAMSEDGGKSFVKQHPNPFYYAPNECISREFRDPKVFKDKEDVYHLFISGYKKEPELDGFGGYLVHLVSKDLKDWKEIESPLTGQVATPECSDYFKWNDWYYLLYSIGGDTYYVKSRKPYGPWEYPTTQAFVESWASVYKTAEYKDNGNSQNNNRASTHWLRNGRYLRLKNLTIGYTIPKKISRKLLMEGARIYFLGNNLAVWDSFGWWDPELASDNGARYPIQKNFTLGLTLNF